MRSRARWTAAAWALAAAGLATTAWAQSSPYPFAYSDIRLTATMGKLAGANWSLNDAHSAIQKGLYDGFDAYDALLQRRIEQITEKDLWGTVLPLQGMFILQYKYNHVRTNQRYDDKGVRGPTIKPLDVFGGSLDFGVTGVGRGHTLTLLYGITDRVVFFAEQQFGQLVPSFNVKYTPPKVESPLDTAALLDSILPELYPNDFTSSLQSLEGVFQAVELFGRPRPNVDETIDDIKFSDFVFGVGYNYYRGKHVNLTAGVKVNTPTGDIADPNNALTYALGPELDVGVGHWGLDFAHFLDVRLPEPFDWVQFTLEFGYAYFFEGKRPAPTTFVPPLAFNLRSEDNFFLAGLLSGLLPPENTIPGNNPFDFAVTGTLIDVIEAVDQVGGTSLAQDLAPVFPDLSNLGKTIDYRPGQQLRGQISIAPLLFGLIPTSFGVSYRYTEASVIKSKAPEFATFVEAVQLVAESQEWNVWGKVTLPLLPLKIPAFVSVGVQFPLAGRNSFVFKDNYEFTFQFISPWFFPEL
ncbi:MAG: hypothetical protein KC466_06720 [Myxococcales bacterium]|nr:hypothetical protein [Myxococcales bacterium]